MNGDDTPPPPSDRTDEQLLVDYRGGRVEAFEALVRRYRPELLPFLIRFAGGRAAGEDLFQETFLQVHLSADTFDASKRFKPWLFTIGANKARDYLRKNKRQRALPLSATVGGASGGGRRHGVRGPHGGRRAAARPGRLGQRGP